MFRILYIFGILLLSICVESNPKDYTVSLTPTSFPANTTTQLSIQISKHSMPLKWSDLTNTSERRLHIVAVHQSLSTQIHIHPEDFYTPPPNSTTFNVNATFPYAGEYIVGLDFMPADGHGTHNVHAKHEEQMELIEKSLKVQVNTSEPLTVVESPPKINEMYLHPVLIQPNDVVTQPLNYSSLATTPASPSPNKTYYVKALTVSGVTAHSCTLLRYQFFIVNKTAPNETSLVPATLPAANFSQFLGSDCHVTIVKSDLSSINHTHGFRISESTASLPCGDHAPTARDNGSSIVGVAVSFPGEGEYRVFLQSKIDDSLIAPSFPLTVEGVVANDFSPVPNVDMTMAIALFTVLVALSMSWDLEI